MLLEFKFSILKQEDSKLHILYRFLILLRVISMEEACWLEVQRFFVYREKWSLGSLYRVKRRNPCRSVVVPPFKLYIWGIETNVIYRTCIRGGRCVQRKQSLVETISPSSGLLKRKTERRSLEVKRISLKKPWSIYTWVCCAKTAAVIAPESWEIWLLYKGETPTEKLLVQCVVLQQ